MAQEKRTSHHKKRPEISVLMVCVVRVFVKLVSFWCVYDWFKYMVEMRKISFCHMNLVGVCWLNWATIVAVFFDGCIDIDIYGTFNHHLEQFNNIHWRMFVWWAPAFYSTNEIYVGKIERYAIVFIDEGGLLGPVKTSVRLHLERVLFRIRRKFMYSVVEFKANIPQEITFCCDGTYHATLKNEFINWWSN